MGLCLGTICSRALGYQRLFCSEERCSSPLIMSTEFCWTLSSLSMPLLHEEPKPGHGAPDVASPVLNKGEGSTPSTCCPHFFTVQSWVQVLGSICWCVTSGINSPKILPHLWKKILLQLENPSGIQIKRVMYGKPAAEHHFVAHYFLSTQLLFHHWLSCEKVLFLFTSYHLLLLRIFF